jgi:predicted O-methyltransferase YrrM
LTPESGWHTVFAQVKLKSEILFQSLQPEEAKMSTDARLVLDEIAKLKQHLARLEEDIAGYQAGIRTREEESASLRYELASVRQQLEHKEQRLSQILDSDSWRITKPLRRLAKVFPRASGAARESIKAAVHLGSFRSHKMKHSEPEAPTLLRPEGSPKAQGQSEPTLLLDPRLEAFLNSCPAIHGKVTHALARDTLLFLEQRVTSGSRTLETGAGLSTLLFAYKSAVHTCVTPWELEALQIRRHCAQHGVSIEQLTFAVGPSDKVLPGLLNSGRLDLVLIDGGHGFPFPFLDWVYCAPRLSIGGIIVIDDTHLWTGAVLRDFLLLDSDWKLEASFDHSAAFRKVKEFRPKEWNEQQYVLKQSEQLC